MRKGKTIYATHLIKNIRMLLAAVITIIFLFGLGCALILETDESTGSTTEPTPETPLSVTAGENTIQPYCSIRSSYFWDEQRKGWLAADGTPVQYELAKIADSLPVITYAEDFSLQYRKNVTLYFITVFSDAFQELQIDASSEATLNTLPEGMYYVIITVKHQGEYVAEGNNYASSSYDCVFKMIVT